MTTLNQLAAESAIRVVLANYCRALDRMELEAAYAVWHADGTAQYHDIFQGTGRGFVDWVWRSHATMERHSHQIAQSLIRVDGDFAVSETYVTAVLWSLPDAGGLQHETIGRGRYLDRWSFRLGRWAIDDREFVLDMQTRRPLDQHRTCALAARDATDPSFAYLDASP